MEITKNTTVFPKMLGEPHLVDMIGILSSNVLALLWISSRQHCASQFPATGKHANAPIYRSSIRMISPLAVQKES
jgi:hypothetical protein